VMQNNNNNKKRISVFSFMKRGKFFTGIERVKINRNKLVLLSINNNAPDLGILGHVLHVRVYFVCLCAFYM
jgi:hypothetical protein